ncbi:Stk1 family PASTA domain-containing Ser/Thr kinase [Yonghaparkia sp. Soil809]|uniref:Stk1 family PASTA domain-containing Ser/Thr kinase n=1 Tax=Yonghaparkia sp. Soil809 TaxID=1736417 RepID=UPI000701B3DA|nr:Stk1 family PASTA domain-containing Ser/Thr kinase [Yonghaparkia sp. Soil809]KRF31437.1 serine/threonine protein kinase [Yonghaparkia sp. Soil809]
MSTSTTDPMIGRLIDGRYHVRSRIARGGMATVYLATDQRLERLVAVKIMHGHLADDSQFTARFIQEARSAARLAHPNVVNVFDQGQDADSAYLVMEYLPGITLRELLQEYGALTPQQTLDIVEAILSGLSAAHKAGIVHRDLKPENVLLADDGRIKIGDFGLARAASAATAAGAALLGTIAYLSPELVTRGVADTRSDIYAVGIMMFEMLTGEQPFKGEQPMQIAFQHANDTVPAPSATNPSVPAELDELVLWATARDPEHRPADARALLEQVVETARSLETSLSATGPQKTMVFTTPLVPPTITAETQVIGSLATVGSTGATGSTTVIGNSATGELARATGRRRKRGWIAFALVLLLALAAGGAGWWFGAGPGAQVTITDVRGQSPEAAGAALLEQGLVVGAEPATAHDLEIPAGAVLGTDPPAGEVVPPDSTVTLVVSLGPEPTTVPAIAGVPEADARTLLDGAGLVVAEDAIRQIDPGVAQGSAIGVVSIGEDGTESGLPEGSESLKGTPVTLVVSLGPLPDVVGVEPGTASAAFEALGLTATVGGDSEFNNDIAEGLVLRAVPSADEPFRPGDAFTLIVSRGPDLVDIPDVIDLTINEARTALEAAGFVPVIDTNVPEFFWDIATVQQVEPSQDGQAIRNSEIVISAFFD